MSMSPPSTPGRPSRWAAGARAVRDALVSNMGDMEGLRRGYRGQSTFSLANGLRSVSPNAAVAYGVMQEAVRPGRAIAVNPYSQERQAVTYGGQDPRKINTSRIRMAHPGNLSENEREQAQRRDVLNYEAETTPAGPPNMSLPGGSFYDFGDHPAAPAMPVSSNPQDMLHRNMSGTLWSDTHTQAMGNQWADAHTRAVSGIGLPGPDPIQGIRAPRVASGPAPLWTPPSY